jgi:hypothetical protein
MPILQTEPHTDTVTITSLKVGDDVICQAYPEETSLYIANIKGDCALCLGLSPSQFIEEIPLSQLELKEGVGRDGTH